jgi:ubiquinol-cytochrome c reductase cytochrome c1 subunit
MKNTFARLFAASALVFSFHAFADEEGPALDPAPVNLQDVESLQRGAKLFTNYCLSCHSAQAMRYNRLTDLGLSIDQIKDNLVFTGAKPGDLMKVGMQSADAKVWLGAPPPDLSVIARSRSADWLYTYLRSFYRDPSRPTGWNNAVFDKVGMPHVLWQQQGDQVLNVVDGDVPASGAVTRSWQEEETRDGKKVVTTHQLVLTKAGTQTALVDGKAKTLDYDNTATDLVNYLVWMSEPAQVTRERVGYGVVLFLLFLLAPLAFFLKKEYWSDVH